MPKSRAQILAAIQKLQRQAAALEKKERASAIQQARTIIGKYSLSADELALSRSRIGAKSRKASSGKSRKASAGKLPPKYRGPDGSTWAGRGKRPVWMREALGKGKKVEDFLIKKKKS